MRFFFGRLFPLPFLISGIVVLFFGVRSLRDANNSTSWPTVPGVVVSSDVDRHTSDDGTTYSAEVLYDYDVDGESYSSNSVSFGSYSSSSSSHARDIVRKYPKGSDVTVAYDPSKPESCILEVGVQLQTWFLPAFGLVFATIGGLMFVFLPILLRKQAEHFEEVMGDLNSLEGSNPEHGVEEEDPEEESSSFKRFGSDL